MNGDVTGFLIAGNATASSASQVGSASSGEITANAGVLSLTGADTYIGTTLIQDRVTDATGTRINQATGLVELGGTLRVNGTGSLGVGRTSGGLVDGSLTVGTLEMSAGARFQSVHIGTAGSEGQASGSAAHRSHRADLRAGDRDPRRRRRCAASAREGRPRAGRAARRGSPVQPLSRDGAPACEGPQDRPHSSELARDIFARRGRPGQRAIYGLANLARQYARDEIEAACEKVLTLSTPSYQAVKRVLEQRAASEAGGTAATTTAQAGDGIRPIDDYLTFFEQHAQRAAPVTTVTERNHDEHVSH